MTAQDVPQPKPLTRAFAFQLFVNLGYAVAVYFFVLLVVFPHYVAPLAAYHEDMYIGADMAALGMPFHTLLFWPRPVLWLLIRLSGQFGYEGSVVFTTAITLLSLAMALSLLERFVLRRTIPWWLALGTLMFAMAGANFYFVAGYDIGTFAAILLGLTGIYAAESRKPSVTTVLLTLLFFTLSALTKESFLPALAVYGIARALRRPFTSANAAFLILPFVAAGIAFIDARLVHSTFVGLSSSASDPYRVSLAPLSVLTSVAFYIAPLDSATFLLLALCCAAGIWVNGRFRSALGLIAAALALYLPYLILPNHRLEYYQWAPMPLLMLLVPLAWTPNTDPARFPEAATPRVRSATRTAIVAALVIAIAGLGKGEYSAFGNWSLGEQNYNRSVLAGIRELKPSVRTAHSILIVGVSNVFHPWDHAEFLSRELGFSGVWFVAAEPGDRPISTQPHAQPIAYDQIHWADYDLVIVFTGGGDLAGSYTGDQVAAIARRSGSPKRSNHDIVAVLQVAPGHSATAPTHEEIPSRPPVSGASNAKPVILPPGISTDPAASAGATAATGLYPSDSPNDPDCCWIAPRAVLPATVTAGTRTIDVHVYLPSYEPFLRQRQTILISAPQSETTRQVIPLGLSDVVVRLLRPARKDGVVRLQVLSSAEFVPASLGINGDQRHLALIVRSVQDLR